jgi:hypothetical protein
MGHPTETAEVMNYLLEAVGKERIRQLQREAAHYRFARRADRRRTRRTWRFRPRKGIDVSPYGRAAMRRMLKQKRRSSKRDSRTRRVFSGEKRRAMPAVDALERDPV